MRRSGDHQSGAAPPRRGARALRTIAVLGPTAAGKTAIALALARHLGAEIISVDSMQVYRGMDIGTAKPSADVRAEVPHHMVDVVEPEHHYTVAEFQRAAREALTGIHARGSLAIITGGSGLHFRAVVDPLEFPPRDANVRAGIEALPPDEARRRLLAADPDAGEHVDLANPRRVVRALEIRELTGLTPSKRAGTPEAAAVRAYHPIVEFAALGLDPGETLPGRVTARFDAMLDAGLLEEVRGLGPRLGPTAREAVGYKQLLPVLAGDVTMEQARVDAVDATLGLAKRQRTYFRRDPRIRWLPWHEDAAQLERQALAAVEEVAWTS